MIILPDEQVQAIINVDTVRISNYIYRNNLSFQDYEKMAHCSPGSLNTIDLKDTLIKVSDLTR